MHPMLLFAPLVFGLFSLSLPAFAQSTRFGLACLGTETGYKINFSWRWGESGTWNQSSVAPGKWRSFAWNYDYPGENKSPYLYIRYDKDLSSGTEYVRTKLKAYAAAYNNCEKHGKTYNFYEGSGGLYIQEED